MEQQAEKNGVATIQHKSGPLVPISSALESVLITGDLSRLNSEQRVEYYKAICLSLGLNPLTKPFDYIDMKGKLVLYLLKAGAQQLCLLHGISFEKPTIEQVGDLYCVSILCRNEQGRTDSDMAALNIKGLSGEGLANAMMKCITKAKRRATLSICGLGILDESEIEDVQTDTEISVRSQLNVIEKMNVPNKTIKHTVVPERGPRTVTPEGDIVDMNTGEVVGKVNAKRKEGPYTYDLPYELPGVPMDKIREQLKKKFGEDSYNPDKKTWNVPRKLENNSLISFDQYLIAVSPAAQALGDDDINI